MSSPSKGIPITADAEATLAPEDDKVGGELTRGKSFKEHAESAKTHYMKHKYKYIAAKVVVIAAVVLGAIFGVIKILALKGKAGSAAALIAGKAGTTIPSVSALPAKKISATRRLLLLEEKNARTLRGLATVLATPSSFAATSDYNTFGATNYVVGDKSVDAVKTINLIGCLTAQIRSVDVGLNASFNPSHKPFVAIIDAGTCGNKDSGVQSWAVKVTGPASLGDGTYSSVASFVGFGGTMSISYTNVVLNSALQKSSVNFVNSMGPGQVNFQGALAIDYTNPSLTDVIFVQESDFGPSPLAYLHASFNPTTFVGSVVSSSDGNTVYALDFNANAINRRTIVGTTAPTSVCFDYSAASMLYSGEQYTLFNANDGSRKQLIQGYSGTFTANGHTAQVYVGYFGLYAQAMMSEDGSKEIKSGSEVRDMLTDGTTLSVQKSDGSVADQLIQRVNAVLQRTSTQTTTLGKLKGVPLKVWVESDYDNVAWSGKEFVRISQDIYRCGLSDGSGNITPVTVASSVSLDSQSDAEAHCICLDSSASHTNGYQLKTSTGPAHRTAWNEVGFVATLKTKLLDGTMPYPVTAEKFQWGMNINVDGGSIYGRVNLPFDTIQVLNGVSPRHYSQGAKVSQPSTGATGTVYKDTPPNIFGLLGTTVNFHGTVDANGILTVVSTEAGTVLPGASFIYNVNGNYNNYYIESQLTTNTFKLSPYGANTPILTSTQLSYTYYFTYTSAGQYDWDYNDLYNPVLKSCAAPASVTKAATSLQPGLLLTQGSGSSAVSGTVTSSWGGYGGLSVSMTKPGTSFSPTGGPLVISVGSAGRNFPGLSSITGSLTFSSGGGLVTNYDGGPPGAMLNYDATKCPKDGGSWSFASLAVGATDTSGFGTLKISKILGGTVSSDASFHVSVWDTSSYVYPTSAGTSCTQTSTDGIVVTLDCGTNVAAAQVVFKCVNRIDASSNAVEVLMTSSSAQFSSASNKPIYMTDANGANQVEISDQWWHGIWWVQKSSGDLQPLSDATTVSLQARTNVQATDKEMPAELWCYDNCPIGAGDSQAPPSLDTYKPVKTLTSVQVKEGGGCPAVSNSAPSTTSGLTFTGFLSTSLPKYTLSWLENSDGTSYSLSSVTITDPGIVDSDATSQEVTFAGSTFASSCSSPPSFNSPDLNFGDYKDFRAARKYAFDPLSGKLTDKTNNLKVMSSGHSSIFRPFGPFFAGTAANRAMLLCDWSPDNVCPYQAYDLDESFSYQTSADDARISLVDAAKNVLPFDAPLTVQYTHSGTDSNSGVSYDGKTLLLTYNGSGDLEGLPQVCVDPITSSVADCVTDSRLSDATSNFADITLSSTTALSGLDGNSYYALAQQVTESFPKAADQSICASLTFASVPAVPDFESVFTAPPNANEPFPTDLSGYLNGGKPVVIKGVTTYEAKQM